MKKFISLSIITIFAVFPVLAKQGETLTLRTGEQKTTTAGKLKIRFVAVESDSRCPVNARCIWAGNARVKITVSKGRKKATSFELNSMLKPTAVSYAGYDIQFVDLSPHPGEELLEGDKVPILQKRINKSRRDPGLTISITKKV